MEQDIRWKQRFENFVKALNKLRKAIKTIEDAHEKLDEDEDEDEDGFNAEVYEMLKEGLIQRFEYTYELAWNVMKDYAEYQGNYEIKGSRDATREAHKMGLIDDSVNWMRMLESRKLTTHTYDSAVAEAISTTIVNTYYNLFESLRNKMKELL